MFDSFDVYIGEFRIQVGKRGVILQGPPVYRFFMIQNCNIQTILPPACIWIFVQTYQIQLVGSHVPCGDPCNELYFIRGDGGFNIFCNNL